MSILHLLENNTYFTLFTCALENALYSGFFVLFICAMASFWNNRTKRKECETAYIIAMVPFAAPAAKTSTNVPSGGTPRLLLIGIAVFVAR
jgi:hypothetical protein